MGKRKNLMVLGVAIILVGIVWFTLNLTTYVKLNNLVGSGNSVEAIAEIYDYDTRSIGTPGDEVTHCYNYFEFFVGESRYTGEYEKCQYGQVIGDSVTIYYNEEDPFENYYGEAISIFYLWPVIFVPIGVGLFIYTKNSVFI